MGDLREAPDVDFVTHAAIVGSDLPRKFDFSASERAACAQSAIPRTVKSQQLPDAIDSEAARLDGVGAEVTLEEPIVDGDVAFRHDAPSGAVTSNLENPVDH
jgi:hypothetical protein